MEPQLQQSFGDDNHKTGNLRRAVIRFEWAQQPIAQMTTARYTFTQFITSLQESLQLQEEMAQARVARVDYGQYEKHPRNFGHPNNRRGALQRSRSLWRNNNNNSNG